MGGGPHTLREGTCLREQEFARRAAHDLSMLNRRPVSLQDVNQPSTTDRESHRVCLRVGRESVTAAARISPAAQLANGFLGWTEHLALAGPADALKEIAQGQPRNVGPAIRLRDPPDWLEERASHSRVILAD